MVVLLLVVLAVLVGFLLRGSQSTAVAHDAVARTVNVRISPDVDTQTAGMWKARSARSAATQGVLLWGLAQDLFFLRDGP